MPKPHSQQPDRQTQLDTDRHTTATPLCGPTRYDLHLRDGTEKKRRTRAKKKRTGQTENEEDRRGSCLFALNCFSLVLNFDRLCLLLGSVSLLSRGQGRRDNMPSLGKGAGVRGSRGCGEGDLELTKGYKYPLKPDDHTESQLEADGRALAGYLATLAS